MEKGTWLGNTIPTCHLSMSSLLHPCPGVPNPCHTVSWGFVSPKQWEGCAGTCQAILELAWGQGWSCGDGGSSLKRAGRAHAGINWGWGLLLGSEKTKEALLELKAALENNPKMVAHYPVEVRFARGDEIWLSPCFQRDSCYMNIIMYR